MNNFTTLCDVCAAEGYPYDPEVCKDCDTKPNITEQREVDAMKIDWKRKLTSRKFWAAVVGVVLSIMILCGTNSEQQERVVAVISSSAVLISYIIGEGLVDKENKE